MPAVNINTKRKGHFEIKGEAHGIIWGEKSLKLLEETCKDLNRARIEVRNYRCVMVLKVP